MEIDFDFGLSQLSGNEALLVKLLGKINTEYADCEARLTAMFDAQNFADARVLIHTLKGVSGNLGCVALHRVCKIIDAELKDSDHVPPSLTRFFKTLNSTLTLIQKVVSEQTIHVSVESEDEPCTSNTRAELMSLLDDNAFIPPDVLSRALQSINLNDDNKRLLEQYINTLDYRRALELLNT